MKIQVASWTDGFNGFQPAEYSPPSPAGVFSGFLLKWKLDPTMRSQRFFPPRRAQASGERHKPRKREASGVEARRALVRLLLHINDGPVAAKSASVGR